MSIKTASHILETSGQVLIPEYKLIIMLGMRRNFSKDIKQLCQR